MEMMCFFLFSYVDQTPIINSVLLKVMNANAMTYICQYLLDKH